MRIISKFHDYYDMMMKQGFDPKLIYNRHTEYLDDGEHRYERSHIRDSGRSYDFHREVIFFCGEVYPLIFVDHVGGYFKNGQDIDHPEYFYDADSAIKFILNLEGVTELYKGYGRDDEVLIRNWIEDKTSGVWWDKEKVSAYKGIGRKISMDHKCPVIYFTKRNLPAVLNPCLKDLCFFKAVDPYTAYQELSMYVGNDLATQDDPDVPVGSDVVIAESKGYDRFSFRQEKSNKKRKNKK